MTEQKVGVEKALPPLDKDDYSHAIDQLSRLDGAIEKEFTLVSDRMTWMVISEAFIFCAFSTATTSRATAGSLKTVVDCLLILMPFLGLFLAFIVMPAIFAAHQAIQKLKNKRCSLEERLPYKLRIELVSAQDTEHSRGNIPPRWVPSFIVGVWMVLLAALICCLIRPDWRPLFAL
ncbi:MAG: hypothetical protein WAM82_27595 [Thermoanaerobaculia bacterium]